MPEHASLAGFYDDAYRQTDAEQADTYARWRALGAEGKADHVIDLCARAGIAPASTLDVGCGDGALLSELHRRGFGGRLAGVEISAAAVALAAERPGIDSVERYDGRRLPAPDGGYDLGILSHVLEHVSEPATLLGEVGRIRDVRQGPDGLLYLAIDPPANAPTPIVRISSVQGDVLPPPK